MATLSGQKIKDAFASLLKLNSNTATTSLKNVESGDGVATALQLATGKVGVNGTLEFPTVPATGTTETSALLLNGSNQVVKRTLNAAAFSGAAVTGAAAPLVLSGSNVTIDNPSTISALTASTIATGDRFLVYDVSTNTWKRIDKLELANSIYSGAYVSAPTVVGRIEPAVLATTTPKLLAYAAAGSSDADSIFLGSSIMSFDSSGGTRTGILFVEDGTYKIDISLEVDTTTSNTDLTIEILVNGIVEMKATRTGTAIGINTASFFQCVTLAGGEVAQVRVTRGSAGACSITTNSVVTYTKL